MRQPALRREGAGRGSGEGTGFVQVSSALGGHACALHESGSIWCGVPHFGPYYDDDRRANPPMGSYRSVSTGGSHTCALRESGDLACWGQNLYEQLEAPAGTFLAVSSGTFHACALRDTGAIACWGGAHPATRVPEELR